MINYVNKHIMYEYKCILRRIIDGDSIVLDIDLGFKVFLLKQVVRLYGIDTPESRTRNLEEKKLGLKSKDRLKELLTKKFIIKTTLDTKGKFGRILAIPYVQHPKLGYINVCTQLISENHARAYFGGKKLSWT